MLSLFISVFFLMVTCVSGTVFVLFPCLIRPLIALFALCKMFMSVEYWANEVKRLGDLLERAEAAHDTFTFDELYPAYVTAQDEYRQAVLENPPFTGWGF